MAVTISGISSLVEELKGDLAHPDNGIKRRRFRKISQDPISVDDAVKIRFRKLSPGHVDHPKQYKPSDLTLSKAFLQSSAEAIKPPETGGIKPPKPEPLPVKPQFTAAQAIAFADDSALADAEAVKPDLSADSVLSIASAYLKKI